MQNVHHVPADRIRTVLVMHEPPESDAATPAEPRAEVGENQQRPGVFTTWGPSQEEQRAMVERVRAALPSAGPEFGDAKRRFVHAVRGSEAISTMGVAAMYLGSHEAGTNPEHDRPLGIFQHHLELIQAMLLRDGITQADDPPWQDLVEITAAARGYTDAWLLSQAQKIERAKAGEQRSREALLFKLRVHAGLLRGWAYQDRMFPLLVRLLEPLGNVTRERLGFEPASLIRWWAAMLELVNFRVNRHRASVLEAFEWPVDDRWISRIEERFGAFGDPASWATLARETPDLRHLYVSNALTCGLTSCTALACTFSSAPFPTRCHRRRSGAMDSWSMSPGEDGAVSTQTPAHRESGPLAAVR